MVNAHFKCRHISQFKGLIDVNNYWKWKDKEKAKLRKDILIQFKLEHCSVIGSYIARQKIRAASAGDFSVVKHFALIGSLGVAT